MDVVTLTGNLLAEWTLEVEALYKGTTHRAQSMSFQVGGKGINVSRILTHLGVDTEAHGFASGPMAQHCKDWLRAHKVHHRLYPLEEGVRPGVVIREFANPEAKETTFLGADMTIPVSSWDTAMREMASQQPKWLAICGSVPGWQLGWLDAIETLMTCYEIEVCVDTYGPPLEDLVRLPLELVKINRDELKRLMPVMENRPTREILAAVSESSPVRNWIITDGPNSIIAAFSNGEIYEVIPIRIKEVSATGSGDTFLATLMQQSLAGANPIDMLEQAAASATANAARAGIADFDLPVPSRFYPQIRKL